MFVFFLTGPELWFVLNKTVLHINPISTPQSQCFTVHHVQVESTVFGE